MTHDPTLLEKPAAPPELGADTAHSMIPTPASITEEAMHYSAQACFDRARILWHGAEGFPVDRGEAALWYEQAANKGMPAAMFAFAECLRWGDGVRRDPERAETLYRSAAEAGEERAIHWLAHAYAVGDGVRPDLFEAAKWKKRITSPAPISPLIWAAFWLALGVLAAALAG